MHIFGKNKNKKNIENIIEAALFDYNFIRYNGITKGNICYNSS
jgi:hypothetical protein